MSRERHRGMIMEGLIMPTKIRKRGCSSSSSSSSRIYNHRLNKRAGKTLAGLLIGVGGSRSSTPVPTWRITPLRSAVDSPKYSQSGRSTQPVSARRLAATLWEMNGMPSPKMSGSNMEATNLHQKKGESKMVFKREKMQLGWSGYLPPHLSDPSHSPTISEWMDRSEAGSRQRTHSISRKLRSAEQNTAAFDSVSNASLMEVETRFHVPTSSASVNGGRSRLKDISNALTTSKELLKIINRLWARVDQPSSSLSVISALHAELERARLQVNHLIKEQHSDKSEIKHLVKCFAEEKASWKVKEQQAVEEAIESIGSELEVERKLRRRVERLNKKLGKELVDLKSSFLKAIEDLESEKRAREITQQMCSELAKNIDEDRNQVEMVKTKAVEAHEEKNSAIGKLRKQLEAFLGTKRDKDEKRAVYCEKYEHEDEGEDTVAVENKEVSGESDIQSIKCHRWACASGTESMKLRVGEIKSRNSISGQVSRRSTSVLDCVEGARHRNSGDGFDRGRLHELEARKRMGLKEDSVLSSSRLLSSTGDYSDSPSRSRQQQDHHPLGGLQVKETSCKSRLGEVSREGQTSRRWKQ